MVEKSNKLRGSGKPVGESTSRPSVENLRDTASELGRITGTEDFKPKRGTGPVASYAKPPTPPKPVK
ncbi:hypothetical protein TUM17577_35260 [Enterobacter asburiae]|nr:hypothetical protein TUM17577_35260 [Enterobacter asburiae]